MNSSYFTLVLGMRFWDSMNLDIVDTRKPASWVFLAPLEGLTKFLSSLYHAWQLLLAKFFDLVKLEFWPPGPPEPPGGQGSNLNSLFRALRWEGFALSIWFGYYERFLRTLKHSTFTNKPKSTRKYLYDRDFYVRHKKYFWMPMNFEGHSASSKYLTNVKRTWEKAPKQ